MAASLPVLQQWGLTFDMSGGPKGAKRPLGRPLDEGVRPLLDDPAPCQRLLNSLPDQASHGHL